MMPEAYAKLIPIPTTPTYKYSTEGAGKFFFKLFYGYLNQKNILFKNNIQKCTLKCYKIYKIIQPKSDLKLIIII